MGGNNGFRGNSGYIPNRKISHLEIKKVAPRERKSTFERAIGRVRLYIEGRRRGG